ncbi:AbrB family transcriptional regulator [Neobacillus niacini]|uniref:AbrB family transcriptional regulator n=1 Tax=Neobacillus niacini TaxID=86668 RepID=UPI003982F61F
MINYTNHTIFRFFYTLLIAFIGGIVFFLITVPIPWLLGPMTAVLIGSRFKKIQVHWPIQIRDIGLIILGYSIGLSFTKEAAIQILGKLPLMLLLTVILVIFCAGIAFFVSKLSGVDYPTILTGSIPGGLSQMITFAEEVKGIDLTTVSFLQVTRVIMIIFSVPFLIYSPLVTNSSSALIENLENNSNQTSDTLFPSIIFYAAICVICAFLGKRLKFPTPFLLGPITATAILTITGLQGPELPNSVMDFSQIMIGGYIGLLLKPEKLQHKGKIIIFAIVSGLVMILGSFGLSMLLVHYNDITPATSLLSLTPGGADQMAILAHEVHADLSIVTGFQLFRLLFIFFAVPPFLKWIFKKKLLRNTEKPT